MFVSGTTDPSPSSWNNQDDGFITNENRALPHKKKEIQHKTVSLYCHAAEKIRTPDTLVRSHLLTKWRKANREACASPMPGAVLAPMGNDAYADRLRMVSAQAPEPQVPGGVSADALGSCMRSSE